MADGVTYPTGQQYRDALFNTDLAFQDPDLRGGEPVTDFLGMPRLISGNFASVFSIQGTDGRRWAVKCFTRHVPDRDARYRAISAFLQGISSPWKVDFEYLPNGVLCQGTWYPLLKMEWVEGTSLIPYVEAHLTDQKELTILAARFRDLVRNLLQHGIAHGDLQDGNILVLPSGGLKLIDYDGMYVPRLKAVGGSELGHPNYQSPHRSSQDWGPDMDRFSAWVVHTSLMALTLDPSLWKELHADGDEALLFHKNDFLDRHGSRARQALLASSDPVARWLAAKVDFLWSPDLAAIPPLGTGQPSKTPAPPKAAPVPAPAPAAALPDWLRHNLTVEGAASGGDPRKLAVAEAELKVAEIKRAFDELVREFDRKRSQLQNAADETRANLERQYEAIERQEADDIAAIDARLNAITDENQGELARALELFQGDYVGKRLERTKIPKYTIPGIGPETVASLAEHGILTAADFTKVSHQGGQVTVTLWDGRTVQPHGLGPHRAQALAAWRVEMEQRARAKAPVMLPKREYDAIVGRQTSSLNHRKTATSTRAEAKKAALSKTIQELNATAAKEITDLESRFNKSYVEMGANLAAARHHLESVKSQPSGVGAGI